MNDQDCSGICKNLSVHISENLYVKSKKQNHKRWGDRYTYEEIENIKNILYNNFHKSDKTRSKGILMVPTSLEQCIIKLQTQSHRPFYGFINKLYKLGILKMRVNVKYVKYVINETFFYKLPDK